MYHNRISNQCPSSVILQCDCVKLRYDSNPDANLSVVAMVTIKGLLPRKKDVLKTGDLDIVLILDTSKSMNGSRMQIMKNLTKYLIKSILKQNHRLGKNINMSIAEIVSRQLPSQLAFLKNAKICHFWGTVCPRKRVLDK